MITLEQIHLFVEVLDRYFGNVSVLSHDNLIITPSKVCELDIIFNFHKAYYIMDELFIGGQLQETSKAEVLRICAAMDDLMDETKEDGMVPGRANAKSASASR